VAKGWSAKSRSRHCAWHQIVLAMRTINARPDYVPYVAAGQSKHVDPSQSLNDPGAHGKHLPPSGPACPALHWQSLTLALPDTDMEFAGQDVHTADPDNGLKVPTPHAVHAAAPSGPVDPELQVHTSADEPVDVEYFP